MSRQDDDYEELDRPRRRRPRADDDFDRPAKKGGSGLIIGLIVGGVVALGCCGTIGVALLLPAVQKVREAGGRAKDTNNFKQIGVGVISHHDTMRELPPATGDLSWRVHILPFIEQDNLYRQFDLDQPWDAPANRMHADVRVPTFVSANDPEDFTQTRYRVFVGPGTLYDSDEPPLTMAAIKDGTDNTLFAVEAPDAVPWPQPKELLFTPNGPLPNIGRPDRPVALILMANGSVRSINKDRIDPALLRGLITPNGKEQLPRDW